MKPVLLIVAIMAVASAEKPRRFDGEQVLKITPAHHDHLKKLWHLQMNDTRLDFWTYPHSLSHPVDVRVPKEIMKDFKTMLDDNQMEYTVMIDDLQQLIDNETASMKNAKNGLSDFDFGIYHTYEEIEVYLKGLPGQHAGVSLSSIGDSVEGRPISMLQIGDGSKPTIILNAGIHSREWVTHATALWIINELLTGDPEFKDKFDFFIIPNLNPDGYVFTDTNNRMWRKNRADNSATGSSCMGVDLNRNWDANWSGPGASNSPCSETYYGPSGPFSEPEIKAVRDLVLSFKKIYGGNIAGHFDLHAYSQYVMSPYGYTYNEPADYDAMDAAMRKMKAAMEDKYGTRYTCGTIINTIYPASGGMIDWMYDGAGIVHTYTFECRDRGEYGFMLPENQIIANAEEVFAGIKAWAGMNP